MINKIKYSLWGNKNTKQIVFKNTFWISLSDMTGKLLRTVLVIYVARFLGVTDYGRFTFSLAYISVFVGFLDLGLSVIITRELACDKNEEKNLFALIALKLFMGLGTFILTYIFSYIITADAEIRKTIWVLSVFSFITQFPEILYAFLRARQRMEFEAIANITQVSLMVTFVFLVIYNFPSIRNISYGYLFSGLITVIPLILFFNFKVYPVKLKIDFKVWKRYLSMSWPLALTSIFGMLYSYIDSIMMGSMGFMKQTGWYNAALKIVYVLSAPASIIAASFYPLLSKFADESRQRLQSIWDFQSRVLIFMALPIVSGGFIIAPKVIRAVYGPDFMPAVPVFRILVIMIAIVFFSTPFSNMLIAVKHQEKIFWITISGAGVNIVLNIILIPRYNLYGAAVASVITYSLILLLYFIFIIKYVNIKPLNLNTLQTFIKAALPCLLMCLILLMPILNNLNVFVLVLIGGSFYMIILLLINKYWLNAWKG